MIFWDSSVIAVSLVIGGQVAIYDKTMTKKIENEYNCADVIFCWGGGGYIFQQQW